jgi:hypothetical protein
VVRPCSAAQREAAAAHRQDALVERLADQRVGEAHRVPGGERLQQPCSYPALDGVEQAILVGPGDAGPQRERYFLSDDRRQGQQVARGLAEPVHPRIEH